MTPETPRRCPYVALMAAATSGTGLTLTADEVRALHLGDGINAAAVASLNGDGHTMVRRYGWGHLRYMARNIRATKTRAMPGLSR